MAGSVKAMELAYALTRRGGAAVTAGLSHNGAFDRLADGLIARQVVTF